MARDITERREAERALRESIAVKDQFLSLVSHELRTPIAIILGNGYLLQRRYAMLSPDERERSVEDITFHAERLQRIIENLLLLTRAGADKEFEVEVIHLPRLLGETIADFRRRNPDRQIDLEIEGWIPPVVGEATITAMVVENLLNNAAKYSQAPRPIEVRVNGDNVGVTVHVLDRGIGLADDELESVSNPFYRSGRAQERAGGMGLGLAVCRTVIESQGGVISASARPGGGVDFAFTLGIADDSHA